MTVCMCDIANVSFKSGIDGSAFASIRAFQKVNRGPGRGVSSPGPPARHTAGARRRRRLRRAAHRDGVSRAHLRGRAAVEFRARRRARRRPARGLPARTRASANNEFFCNGSLESGATRWRAAEARVKCGPRASPCDAWFSSSPPAARVRARALGRNCPAHTATSSRAISHIPVAKSKTPPRPRRPLTPAFPSRPTRPSSPGARRDVTVAARHVALIRPGATEAQSDDTYEVDDCFGSDLGTAEAYKRILHPSFASVDGFNSALLTVGCSGTGKTTSCTDATVTASSASPSKDCARCTTTQAAGRLPAQCHRGGGQAMVLAVDASF